MLRVKIVLLHIITAQRCRFQNTCYIDPLSAGEDNDLSRLDDNNADTFPSCYTQICCNCDVLTGAVVNTDKSPAADH